MRNVMKKAWEIARDGVRKFGGSVKEYFAEALKMAWAVVKNGMEIGFEELPGKNGNCYFVVNEVEGLEVNLLTEKKNLYNGKMYTKRTLINDFRRGVHKITGKAIRLYTYAWHCGDIEIRLGEQKMVIDNHIDKAKWGL